MMSTRNLAIALAAVAASAPAGVRAATPRVAQLGWLAGAWSSDQDGAHAEEHWMAPRDGSLVGMFRLLRGGKVAFVELLTISDAPSGPTLRIRHFDLGLAPSESTPLVYVAVSAAPATITFEHPTDPVRRLTFRRTPAGLSVTLDLRRGGSRVFTYAPMRPRLPRRP